jgi:GPH family glycoside/pentoside/hexuronide:cation symporter
LTLDYDERTSLLSYRMFVSIVAGLLVAVLLGEIVFPAFEGDEQTAFLVMGIVCGAIFVVPVLITFLGTQEREEFQTEEPSNPLEGIRFVMDNKAWRYTLSMGLLSWLPVDIASAVFPFFLIYWIGMNEGDSSMVLGVILASATLFLPLVLWLSRRTEKNTAFIIATATWAVIMLAILFVPEGAVTLAFIVAFLTGFGVASAHLLPNAMSTDVLEVDELNTGMRQEGIYAGFSVFVRKLSIGLVLAVVGPVLAWSGYVEGADTQTGSALTAIRILISVLPAALLVLACVIAWFYPITRERHAAITDELALRRTARQRSE